MGKLSKESRQRLKASRKDYLHAVREEGQTDGADWASNQADYGELLLLSERWPRYRTTDAADGTAAAYLFVSMISDDESGVTNSEVNEFWERLGKAEHDPNYSSGDYFDAFVESALEVFESIDEREEAEA